MPDVTDLREAFARLEQEFPDGYRSPVVDQRLARLISSRGRLAPRRIPRVTTAVATLLAAAVVLAIAVGVALLRGTTTNGRPPATQTTSPRPSPSHSTSAPKFGALPADASALVTFVQGGRVVSESGYQQGAFAAGQPMQPTPGQTQFTTPSGNISCGLIGTGASAQASCVVEQHSWPGVPKPAGCTLNWGASWLIVDPSGVSRGQCLGGPPFAPVSSTLTYGTALRHGPLVCRSASAFLACADVTTRHGFAVNRTDVRTY